MERGCTRAAGVCGARAGAAGFWGSPARGGRPGRGHRLGKAESAGLGRGVCPRRAGCVHLALLGPRKGTPSPPLGGGPCVPSRASAWVGVPSLVHCGPLSFCIPDLSGRVAPLPHVPPSPLGNPLFPHRILRNGPSGSGPGTLLVGNKPPRPPPPRGLTFQEWRNMNEWRLLTSRGLGR